MSEQETAAGLDLLLIVVPGRHHPTHHVEVVYRGNTFEIAYDTAVHACRAEAQFVWTHDDEVGKVVLAVREYLKRIRAGEIVVVRYPLGRLTTWLRRDGARHVARFVSAPDAERQRGDAIYTW